MKNQSVGTISAEERDYIQAIHYRKSALLELFSSMTHNSSKTDHSDLFDKLVSELSAANQKYQAFWDAASQLHQWPSIEGGSWELNFTTCEVFLVGGKKCCSENA